MNLINFAIGMNIVVVGAFLICRLFSKLHKRWDTGVGSVVVTILLCEAMLFWVYGFAYLANKYLPL